MFLTRLFALLVLALASGASAQTSDLLSGTSLGVGPASGFESTATYVELRERVPISPVLAIEPLFGLSVESGYSTVFPCLVAPCPESRVGETVRIAPGAAFTLRAPAATLPGPLASAHVGALGQVSMAASESREFRYGVEAGAAFRVTEGLTLGADVQAVRYARSGGTGLWGDRRAMEVRRASVVPMLRVSYAPEASGVSTQPSEAARTAYSLGSGPASGFRAGALQTELRASIPLGAGALAFEPAIAWTAAVGYDAVALCAPGAPCPPGREGGADAISLGAGLTGHSGRFQIAGVPLADAHLGAAVHLVNPTAADPNEVRFALFTGVSAPVFRGVAVGAEVQASAYTEPDIDRDQLSLVPMLRLVVGG